MAHDTVEQDDAGHEAMRQRADAVRYMLLQRLQPALNHKLAGTMQPIAMIAAMMARRLKKPAPELDVLAQNTDDIVAACKAATATRSQLLGWLGANQAQPVSVATAIAQCTELLHAEFAMRGCSLHAEDADDGSSDHDCAESLRHLLCAVLYAVVDTSPVALALVIRPSKAAAGRVCIRITCNETKSAGSLAGEDVHMPRPAVPMGWDDVRALAAVERARLEISPSQVDIEFAAHVNPEPR